MHADVPTGLHRQSEVLLKSKFSAFLGKTDDGRTRVDFIGYGDHYVPVEEDGDDDDDKYKDDAPKKDKDNGESKRLV